MIKVRNDYGQPVSSEAIGAGSVEIIPCHTSGLPCRPCFMCLSHACAAIITIINRISKRITQTTPFPKTTQKLCTAITLGYTISVRDDCFSQPTEAWWLSILSITVESRRNDTTSSVFCSVLSNSSSESGFGSRAERFISATLLSSSFSSISRHCFFLCPCAAAIELNRQGHVKTSPQWETSIDIFLFPGLILKIFSSVGIEKLYTVVLLGYFLFKFFLRKRKGILYSNVRVAH